MTTLFSTDVADDAQNYSYCVDGIENAIRHASSLISILHTAVVPRKSYHRQVISVTEHLPWLADSLESLNEEQKRWKDHYNHTPVPLLKLALDLTGSLSGVDEVISYKLDSIVVLLSADVAGHPTELIGQGQNARTAIRTLALALVHLAEAGVKKRPVSKLISSQLLKPLERLLIECTIYEETNDLHVGFPTLVVLLRLLIPEI